MRLRHIVTQYDWDDDAAEQDGPVREAMEESARHEHSTLRALGQCEHWVKLHADVGAETEAVVGTSEEAERYPCVFVEGFESTPLHEALSSSGCGDDVDAPPTADELERDLDLVFAVGLSCARALDEAHHAGYACDESGKGGPFLGGVGVRERSHVAGAKKGARFEVKLTVRARGERARGALAASPPDTACRTRPSPAAPQDVDGLEPCEAGAGCNLHCVVYSPVGAWIQEWWGRTALKLGMTDGNSKPADAAVAAVLDKYGTLNWLIFGWPKEQLGAESLISLMEHGPTRVPRPRAKMEQLERCAGAVRRVGRRLRRRIVTARSCRCAFQAVGGLPAGSVRAAGAAPLRRAQAHDEPARRGRDQGRGRGGACALLHDARP